MESDFESVPGPAGAATMNRPGDGWGTARGHGLCNVHGLGLLLLLLWCCGSVACVTR